MTYPWHTLGWADGKYTKTTVWPEPEPADKEGEVMGTEFGQGYQRPPLGDHRTFRVYPPFDDSPQPAGDPAKCPPTGFASPQPGPPMTAEEILAKASDLISGDRNDEHGDRGLCHKNIAALWSAYLDIYLPPYKVALMMALLKIARSKTGTFNMDNFVDLPGYGALAGELAAKGIVEIK